MDVTITTAGGKTILDAPYHPAFPAKAKRIGGKYLDGAWRFDARDEDRVRELARATYGTDGTDAVELVTVHLDMTKIDDAPDCWFAARRIARRAGRDDQVKLGKGVIIVQGGFKVSAGSAKYPEIGPEADTILEVRDLPRSLVERETRDYDDGAVTIVGGQGPDVDALLAERERLLARLTEIDAQLPEPEGVEASTREAAQALGVSVRTVQRWAAKGKVTATKDGRGHWIITITVTA